MFVRSRWVPAAGSKYLNGDSLKEKKPDFLFTKLSERLKSESIAFKLLVQVAEEEDVTDDCTCIWPEDRKIMELGTLKLESIVEEHQTAPEGKAIIFDPIPRIEGVEPSTDPILMARAGVYLISGRARRAIQGVA